MNYIGNQPEFNVVHTDSDRYDYVFASNPTIDINPSVPYATWLNILTGELFICMDTTIGLNIWKGQNGSYIVAYEPPISDVLYSFSSPGSSTAVMSFGGANLLSIDRTTDLIYVHDGLSSVILNSLDLGSDIIGIAFDGEHLIAADNATNSISVYLGLTDSLVDSYPSINVTPFGLAFDGTNLIEGGWSNNEVYIHAGITSTIIETISLGYLAYDIAVLGGNLVVADSVDTIHVYDGITNSEEFSFPSPSTGLVGVAFGEGRLISSDNVSNKIYVHKNLSES